MDLEILKAIQTIRSDFFDYVFSAITFMGTDLFVFVMMCTLFWCNSRDKGELFIFTVFLSFTVNNVLKDFIKRPRPIGDEGVFTDETQMHELEVNNSSYPYSWSFPSGHAQGSATLFTLLGIEFRKKPVIISCILAILLVMLSRVYLGVHYPSDVAVGAALGIAIAFLGCFLYKKFNHIRLKLYLILAIVLLPFAFFGTDDSVKSLGGLMGFAVGMLLEKRFVNFKVEGRIIKRCLRLFLGVALLLGIRLGLKELFGMINPDLLIFEYIRYFVILFFATALYPWFFKKINL